MRNCGGGSGGRYRVLSIRTSSGDVKAFRLDHVRLVSDEGAVQRQRAQWLSEGRLSALQSHMNNVLRGHVQSRRRQLAYHVAPSIALGALARALPLPEEHTSLWDVITRRLVASGIDALDPLIKATTEGYESAARLAHPTTLQSALTALLRNVCLSLISGLISIPSFRTWSSCGCSRSASVGSSLCTRSSRTPWNCPSCSLLRPSSRPRLASSLFTEARVCYRSSH